MPKKGFQTGAANASSSAHRIARAAGVGAAGANVFNPAHHCRLVTCQRRLASSITGGLEADVSIATGCCGGLWCAGCLLIAFIGALPNALKCGACGAAESTLNISTFNSQGIATKQQSTTIPPAHKWTLGRHTRRFLKLPAAERRGGLVLQVVTHPSTATYSSDLSLMYEQVLWPGQLDNLVQDRNRQSALATLLAFLHQGLFLRAPVSVEDCHQLAGFEHGAATQAEPLAQLLRILGTGSVSTPTMQRLAGNYYDRKTVNGLQVLVDVLRKMNSPGFIGPTQSLVTWVICNSNKTQRDRTMRALCLAGESEAANRDRKSVV